MNATRFLFGISLLFFTLTALAQQPERLRPEPGQKECARGMTWMLLQKAGELSLVGSDKQTDAYLGDTDCSAFLPILAIKRQKLPKPPELVIESRYNEWSGGSIALTRPVQGFKLTSLEQANRIIQEELGPEWEMAEFHDGWGWHFWAYGTIQADQRFWVSINDQHANPWNSTGKRKGEM